ncbi:MAG TPA: peptidoglycan bridge formation glycyltransferase FemA/FemB family protein [Amaricoccus sp.]|uniref:lipid II:glycine glycyltransferase FemX n=1 Tax=Amaricoccus sp. TaxID=1872485 RepID=UPI002BBD3917|nr:peptidoglycan bridge formation glycyltransferase FemA/FemB family protein [Amaricoccus sp.]HMR31262.1 peptidoglycan bridge formation glycyltransferase FemA/FemB family protein [Geminicoccus sp.]HMU00258.1 peptidoglycan bridge formation glycyltransferase FemA/FemB family protein [Amaricoccus sp.]
MGQLAGIPAPVDGAARDAAGDSLEGPEADTWDHFVASVAGDVTQTTAWGRSKQATGSSVVMAISRAESGIRGGALILIKRLARFVAVGYVARGPLLLPSATGTDVVAVLDEIERQARRRGLLHLVIQPPLGGDAIAAELAARGYSSDAPEVSPGATLLIDLTQGADAVLAGMSPSRRRNVRQATQGGLDVGSGDRDDIERFQSLHASSAGRQGFQPLPTSYLFAQWDALRPASAVELVTASLAGRTIAGIWLTVCHGTVTYRLPGWSGEAARLQPNVACHWYAIRQAIGRGDHSYDLGGIDRSLAAAILHGEPGPPHGPQTPAAFKLGFGGDPVLLPRAFQRTLNPLARPLVRAVLAGFGESQLLRAFLKRLRAS